MNFACGSVLSAFLSTEPLRSQQMTKNIYLLLTISLIAFNADAAKPAQDVNVINAPDVNVVNTPSVTVTNPQTSVTVDNTTTNPVPVTVQGGLTASAPQFVGFSNDSVQGDVGLVGMHGACAATYGSSARMCFEIEVFKTPNLQSVPGVIGWLQENLTSGLLFPRNSVASCFQWNVADASGVGAVLEGDGMRLGRRLSCATIIPVACCQ